MFALLLSTTLFIVHRGERIHAIHFLFTAVIMRWPTGRIRKKINEVYIYIYISVPNTPQQLLCALSSFFSSFLVVF